MYDVGQVEFFMLKVIAVPNQMAINFILYN
jgi:hypothetical protein